MLVRTLGLGLPSGEVLHDHNHPWHQLLYAARGVMAVETETGSWVVPPERAVWVPARFEHSVRAKSVVRMQTLYIEPSLVDDHDLKHQAWSCCVVEVSPLLGELIAEIRSRQFLGSSPADLRLALVLLDQIDPHRAVPLQIVVPDDPRARRVADEARSNFAAARSLHELARDSGASPRTIERLFLRETGLTFGRWHRRVKALHALELLALGSSVTSVANAVGYDSTSAFIAMFRRTLGTTPGTYFSSQRRR